MSKEGTVILPCVCQHEFQDETYGRGQRVHNVTPKGDAFCTVCGPRNISIDKMAGNLDPMPHIGFMGTPPKKLRQPKRA